MAPHGRQPNLRLVDNFIAAFHVKDTELLHWAMTHPEYSHAQVGLLCSGWAPHLWADEPTSVSRVAAEGTSS